MPRFWRRFAEKVQLELTLMANGLLSFAVLLTCNCNCRTFGEGLASLPMLVVSFLRSMWHLCLLCNGSVFAVMPNIISLTLPAHGPQARIYPIQTNSLPLFCLLSSKLTKCSSQSLVVMNGLSMGQLLPRQFRKTRARAQTLLLTLRSLHLARSFRLCLYFPSLCFTARRQ